MKQEVIFIDNGRKIKIKYERYGSEDRGYCDLFDYLSDSDIITASELDKDVVLHDGCVYYFTNSDEIVLRDKGEVIIENIGNLVDLYPQEKGFIAWYY